MPKLVRWLLPATLVALFAAVASAHAAATYTVNTIADNPAAGGECSGVAGDCSLRQALDKATSGDTVFLPASSDAYSVSAGKITVPGGVTIQGAGASSTTVSGGGTSQIFDIESAAPVTIESLTLADGHNPGPPDESATIENSGPSSIDLTLDSVVIRNGVSAGGYGGALEAGGNFTIRNSSFIDNSASLAHEGGGAIDFYGPSTVTITNSVFRGNSQVSDDSQGGAILFESGGTVNISSSTFSGNSVGGTTSQGGALYMQDGETATITNSTFNGNSAPGPGGAIALDPAATSLSLSNDTFAGDSAPAGADLDDEAPTTAQNTIFATATGGGASCSAALATTGHDLDDSTANSCGLSAGSGDLIGANPALAPLADNLSQVSTPGGPPQTMALPATSPAVRAGDATACAGAGGVDERGFPRPGIPGAGCDIGAFEGLGTSTSASASSSNATLHQPVTVTATIAGGPAPAGISAPSGTVIFKDGATVLGSAPVSANHASLTTTALAAGTHAVTATYSGDGVYYGSAAAPVTVTVFQSKAPKPSISRLGQSHKKWRLGSKHARLSKRGTPVGTVFRFKLNTNSTVRLTFRRLVGHKKRSAGTLTFKNAKAGQRKLAFQGRLKGHRKLKPGRYTMTLTASNSTGHSSRTLRFTIVR